MRTALLMVVAVLALSVAWGQPGWVDVGTHAHSNFSDGTLSIDGVLGRFRSSGHQFVAIADHAETINSTEKKSYQLRKEVGVDNWYAQIASHADVVPGVECGLGAGRKSHLLNYRGRLEGYRKIVSTVEEKGESDPRGTVKYLRDLADASAVSTVLIVAHPFCTFYPFTEPVYGMVDGVEVFDGIGSDPVKELKLIAMMARAYERPLTVVTGSDFHGVSIDRLSEATGDITQDRFQPALERRTLVHASDRNGIVPAIERAECYATFKRARIASASAWPGGKHDPSNIFKMSCSGMNKALGKEAFVLLVGRGGQSMSAYAPLEWKGNSVSLSLDLKGAPPDMVRDGAFLYLLIAGQLATSGIEVSPYDGTKIATQPKPAPAPTPEPEDQGGWPDFGGGLGPGGFDLGKMAEAVFGRLKAGRVGGDPINVGKALLAVLEWALVDRGVISRGNPTGSGSGSTQGSQGGLGIPTTGGGDGGGGSLSAAGPQGNLKVPKSR